MNEHPLTLCFVGFRWERKRYGLKHEILAERDEPLKE